MDVRSSRAREVRVWKKKTIGFDGKVIVSGLVIDRRMRARQQRRSESFENVLLLSRRFRDA